MNKEEAKVTTEEENLPFEDINLKTVDNTIDKDIEEKEEVIPKTKIGSQVDSKKILKVVIIGVAISLVAIACALIYAFITNSTVANSAKQKQAETSLSERRVAK